MVECVLAVVVLDGADGVPDEHRAVVAEARAAGGVEDADVREGATDEEVVDAVRVEVALEVGLVEGVVGVLHDDVVVRPGVELVDEFGLPGPLEDVFGPAVELVVVVGVRELLGRMDVPREDDARASVPGAVDEVGAGFDGVLAAWRVEASVRMTESVLHVDDEYCGGRGVERGHTPHSGTRRKKGYSATTSDGVRNCFPGPCPSTDSMRRLALALAALLVLSGCAAPTPDVPIYDGGADGPSDPETDVLGWEQGIWHNETIDVDPSDGLSHRELNLTVARSMARVEHIRGLEFDKPVPVSIITRAEYRNQSRAGNTSETLRTFDNTKFEALFLVGEQRNALAAQEANRGSSVLGYYSPSRDEIVIVSNTEQPSIEETTLGHELYHAVQFRTFDPNYQHRTRDEGNANDGLIEGDARYVDQQYGARCGDEWSCVSPPVESSGGSGGNSQLHLGIYLMKYFPYSDGPGFVAHIKQNGGWAAVNDVYDAPPKSSEQVMTPAKYQNDPPTTVQLADTSSSEWEWVQPRGRAAYGEVGVGGITAMFAYPSYDSSRSGTVLRANEFLNLTPSGEVSSTDPINYDINYTEGWDGEKLYVYENDAGETAYTWRLAWDSDADAREFRDGYVRLLRYWGAEQRAENEYVIPEGESNFADAFRVTVDGDTVTIVNAPDRGSLDDVHA